MSVCSNLLTALLIVIPGVPALYQVMSGVPDIALSSSMACRVFRNLKTSANMTNVASLEFSLSEAAVGHIGSDILLPPTGIPLKSEVFQHAKSTR